MSGAVQSGDLGFNFNVRPPFLDIMVEDNSVASSVR